MMNLYVTMGVISKEYNHNVAYIEMQNNDACCKEY